MLTDEMREYLRQSLDGALLWDVTMRLTEKFNLTQHDAEACIIEWIRETV